MRENEANILKQIFGDHAVILFETEESAVTRMTTPGDLVSGYVKRTRAKGAVLGIADIALLSSYTTWLKGIGRLWQTEDPATVNLTETAEILRGMPDLGLTVYVDGDTDAPKTSFSFDHGKHRFTFKQSLVGAWQMLVHGETDLEKCLTSRPIGVLADELDPWILALGALKAAREFEVAERTKQP